MLNNSIGVLVEALLDGCTLNLNSTTLGTLNLNSTTLGTFGEEYVPIDEIDLIIEEIKKQVVDGVYDATYLIPLHHALNDAGYEQESIKVAEIVVSLHNNNFDFSKCKVGDKVTCAIYGKGYVDQIQHKVHVVVRFFYNKGSYLKRYTLIGALEHAKIATLHHRHVDLSQERVALADAVLGGVMPLDTIKLKDKESE